MAIFVDQELWTSFRNVCAEHDSNETLVIESLLSGWLGNIDETRSADRTSSFEDVEIGPAVKECLDPKTTAEIFHEAVHNANVDIPEDVEQFIIQDLQNDPGEVQRAVTWFTVLCSFSATPMTVETAKTSLATFAKRRAPERKFEEIQSAVAQRFQIRVEDLRGTDNSKRILRPRQIAMYLTRQLTDTSFSMIGRLFGNRQVTTVKNAVAYVEQHQLDVELGGVVDILMKQIAPIRTS
jgi:chromosomal replication initiator protein